MWSSIHRVPASRLDVSIPAGRSHHPQAVPGSASLGPTGLPRELPTQTRQAVRGPALIAISKLPSCLGARPPRSSLRRSCGEGCEKLPVEALPDLARGRTRLAGANRGIPAFLRNSGKADPPRRWDIAASSASDRQQAGLELKPFASPPWSSSSPSATIRAPDTRLQTGSARQ